MVIGNLFGRTYSQSQRLQVFNELDDLQILSLKEEKQQESMSQSGGLANLKINRNLFQVDFDSIKIIKSIGEGGSNIIVYLGEWMGSECAFKCFKTQMFSDNNHDFSEFEKEVEILSSLHHQFIINFLGATIKPPRIGILMEYCCNGDLKDFLTDYKKKKSKRYPQSEKLRMLFEVSYALEYCHSINVVHLNIKLENILVSADETTRLMDFGLSKIFQGFSQQRAKTHRIGTNVFMAPEITRDDDYDEKVDVFSFAILMLVLMTENFEPYGDDNYNVEFKVASSPLYRPSINPNSKDFKEIPYIYSLIILCWNHHPENRPHFKEISKAIQQGKTIERQKGKERNMTKQNREKVEEEEEEKNITSLKNEIKNLKSQLRKAKEDLKTQIEKS